MPFPCLSLTLRACVLAALIAQAPAADAAAIFVDTLADELNNDGDCSLREAVQAANTNAAVDDCVAGNSGNNDGIIVLLAGTIELSQGLVITEGVTLSGGGWDVLELVRAESATGFSMIEVDLVNDAHDFRLSGLAIRDGEPATTGGAVHLQNADLVVLENLLIENNLGGAVTNRNFDPAPPGNVSRVEVRGSRFRGNKSLDNGAGLYLTQVPEVEITGTIFERNEAQAGLGAGTRLSGADTVSITDTVFLSNRVIGDGSSNGADAGGGLAITSSGQAALSRVTFSRNRGPQGGGALYLSSVDASLDNATIYSNGNAIHVGTEATLDIAHATFVANYNTGGALQAWGQITVSRSVFTPNGGTNVFCGTHGDGAIQSGGFNHFATGDLSCGPAGSDRMIDDAKLLPLGDYGSAVPVMPPDPSSPLVDDADYNDCLSASGLTLPTDARGRPRPVAANGGIARCDVGAVEWDPASDDWIFRHDFDY